MMSKSNNPLPISDEVLSAYFDGELPHDERAQVERWLAGSAEARQRLEDFRQLSGFLQDLPRAELPTEFAQQVLQQAERRMLLPAVSLQSLTPWRRARWWTLSVVAPLTAVAALLFISLTLNGPAPRPGNELARHVIEQPSATNGGFEGHSPIVADARDSAIGARAAVASAAPAAVAEKDESAGNASPSDASLPVDSPPAIAADTAGSDLPADDETATRLASLVGSIRETSDRGQTAVVRVYVVDRSDGMELVQLVLDRNHIPREQPDAAASKKTEASAASSEAVGTPPGTAPASAGHDALFVVADVAELQRALTDLLARKGHALAWKLEEPIDMDRLDRGSQERVEQALAALGEIRPKVAAAEVAAARAPARKASPMRSGAESTVDKLLRPSNGVAKDATREKDVAPTPSSAGGKPDVGLANVKSEGSRLPGRVAPSTARQVRVSLAESSAAEPLGKVGESAVAAKEADSAEKNEAPAARRSLVRVILLVEPQAPVAPPANAAPAEPKPGDGAA